MTYLKYLSVLLVSVLLFGCASGSHTITGEIRPEIEVEQVTVFSESPTFDYVVIGVVRVSSGNNFTESARIEDATEELKEQSAKIGANGVILDEVIQLSFRSVGSNVGLGVGSNRGVSTSLGSSFTFPTTEMVGTAIYYEVGSE